MIYLLTLLTKLKLLLSMFRAFNQFKQSIAQVKELDALYTHLKNGLHLPNDLSDLLRAQWVYCVSALDKLIHELVRIGMIQSFLGSRIKTNKFQNFSISIDNHSRIIASTSISIPPPEYWFEQEIVKKHKILSFQEPEKIADGLSLIWNENHKWQKIANDVGIPESDLKIKLKTIISRRNQIVHEADIDIISGNRINIDKSDMDDVSSFIELLGEAIYNNVK